MALRSEAMTVQWSPAWPVYVEHSFVRRKSPLRGEDTARGGASAVALGVDALGLVGIPRPSLHAAAANVPTQRDPRTARFIVRRVANFISTLLGRRVVSQLILCGRRHD